MSKITCAGPVGERRELVAMAGRSAVTAPDGLWVHWPAGRG